MPTQVQQPELQQAIVGQYRERYQDPQGNGDFLNNLLAIGKGIKDQQTDARDANLALGAADEADNVVRDVSFLNQKYYNQGHAYQAIVNQQAQNTALFKQDATQGASQGFGAQDILELGKPYTQSNVQAIVDADLDQDIKQKLYQSTIQDHIAQQKQVTASLLQQAQVTELNSRATRASSLAQSFTDPSLDPDARNIMLSSYLNTATAGRMNAGDKPEEAFNGAVGEVTGVIKYANTLIKQDPTNPNNIALANNLRNALPALQASGNVPLSILSEMQDVVSDTQHTIQHENGNAVELQQAQTLNDALVSNQWGADQANTQIRTIQDLQANHVINSDKAVSLINNVTSFTKSHMEKALSAKPNSAQIVMSGMSLSAYQGAGYGGESEYSKAYLQGFLSTSQSPMEAGAKSFTYASGSAEYLPTLMRESSDVMTRQFSGALNMSPEQAQKDPNFQRKLDNFNTFKQLYNNVKNQQGGANVSMLLSGLPDNQRSIVQQVLDNNGTMSDAMQLLANPIQTDRYKQNLDAQIKNFDYDKGGLPNWFGGLSGTGALGREIPVQRKWYGGVANDNLRNVFANQIADVAKDSASGLTTSSTTTDPKDLVTNMQAKGMFFRGADSYSSMVVNSAKATTLRNIKGYDNTTIPETYVGASITNFRSAVAKMANVDPSQVMVKSTGVGNTGYILFTPYDKDGRVLAANGALNGVPIKFDTFINNVKSTYQELSGKYKAKNQTFTSDGVNNFGGVGGNASFTVNTKGTFAPTTLRTSNGSTVSANIPNLMTVPYNGNTDLTKSWINHLNQYESFSTGAQQVQGLGTSRNSTNIGHGVSLTMNPDWKAKFDSAKTPQDVLNVQAQFTSSTMKNIQSAASKVGIPVATTAPYPTQHVPTQMLLADAKWHGGQGGLNGIVQILQQPDSASALNKLRTLPIYKHTTPDKLESDQRNVWYRQAVQNYFRNK